MRCGWTLLERNGNGNDTICRSHLIDTAHQTRISFQNYDQNNVRVEAIMHDGGASTATNTWVITGLSPRTSL